MLLLLITVITAAQTYAASGPRLPAEPGCQHGEQLLLPGQLGSRKPGSCPSSRSSLHPGQLAWQPTRRASQPGCEWDLLLPPHTACCLPGEVGIQGHILDVRNSIRDGVSGKAGCKTGMSFRECFQAMDFTLEVLQRASPSSAWGVCECWGGFM